MKLLMVTMLSVGLLFSSGFCASKTPDLVKACKKECPEAKNNETAFKCAEELERDQAKAQDFIKSDCFKKHIEYEMRLAEKSGELNKDEK